MAKLPQSPADRHVGQRLTALRTSNGVTQARLAGILGIPLERLQSHENGESRIDAGLLLEIARFFRVRPSTFFDGLGRVPSDDSPAADETGGRNVIPLERNPKEP